MTFVDGNVAADRVGAALAAAFGGQSFDVDGDSNLLELRAGDLLCDVGEEATTAWVVVSGRLQAVMIDAGGSEQSMGIVGPGELIGESALLEDGCRGARVRALRGSVLVELDRGWLAEQLSQHADASVHLMRTILDRAHRNPVAPAGVLAVVPLDSTVMDQARAIAEAARESTSYGVVDGFETAGAAKSVLGNSGSGRFGMRQSGSEWLDEAERRDGGVILLGDPTERVWSTTVVELADRVLFVVDAARGPSPRDLEQEVLRAVPRQANDSRMLALVHPHDTDRPRGTTDWLDHRDVDRHLHLRRRRPGDTHRVARHLVGRPLTMAVGAGGVRSAGAVGTIRSLTARHVAIDGAAGVSGGAIIASWLAMSDSLDELEDRTDWSMRKLLDFTIPVGSVIAGKRAWTRIREAVGDRDIADTWLPLSIVTTDLTSGVPVNHTRGAMADVLYASISIPGVFPPVDIDGHLHVDGAVFDAIAVDAARELVGEGELVVVDLAPPHGRSTDPLPRVMQGWRLLLRRVIPGVRSPRVPNPLDTLMRSTTVASASRRIEALESVDCHVHLNLSEFSVLEFDKVRLIASLGEAQSNGPINAYLASDEPPLTDPTLVEAARAGTLAARSPQAGSGTERSAGLVPAAREESGRFSLASLGGSLSLAWADLRSRAKRFAVAGFASSVVLALLLQMTGVVNQLQREPYVAVDAFGGSAWILPDDADGAFTSNATFEESMLPSARATGEPGGPVLLSRFRLTDRDGKDDLDVILVGQASLPEGALELREGRLAAGGGEVTMSRGAGYSLGDSVKLGPTRAKVVGVVDELSVFAGMPLLFVHLPVAQDIVLRGQRLVSAVVVADESVEVPDGLSVVEADDVAEDALGPIERPISTLRLVQILLAVVAALIIGAVVYLATLDRLRDIAVMRAMGVRSGVIGLGVAVQALGIGLVAGAAALVIQTFLAPAFPLSIHLTTSDRIVLVAVAMIVAGLASYAAIRRTLRIDPAEAFGGQGA